MAENLDIRLTGLEKDLKKINGQMDNLEKNAGSVKDAFQGLAGAFAFDQLLQVGGKLVDMFDLQAKAVGQVGRAVESTGGSANRTLEQLTKTATDLQKKTLFGDEEILKGATLQLLTFTNIANEEFDRTQQVALDVATVLDQDLKSTAIQLGKALNDPVANMGALSRSGIQFSKEQKATIKAFADTNQLAKAQGVILTELERQYGGQAEASAKLGSGALTQLGNRFDDIQESMGGVLFGMIKKILPAMNSFFGFIENNIGVVTDLGLVLGFLGTALAIVTVGQYALNLAMSLNPISLIVIGVVGLIAAFVILVRNNDRVKASFMGLWSVIKKMGENMKTLFDPFIEAFDLIMSGKYIEGMKKLGRGLLNLTPVGLGMTLADGIGEAFNQGFDESMQNSALEDKLEKVKKLGGAGAVGGMGIAPTTSDATSSTISTASGKVAGTSQKNINITLDSLVENFSVETQNITDSVGVVRDKFAQMLLGLLNETNRIAD